MDREIKIFNAILLAATSFGIILIHNFSNIFRNHPYYRIDGDFNNLSELDGLIKEGFYRTSIMNPVELIFFVFIPCFLLLIVIELLRKDQGSVRVFTRFVQISITFIAVFGLAQITNLGGAYLGIVNANPFFHEFFEIVKYDNANSYSLHAVRVDTGGDDGVYSVLKISFDAPDDAETIRNYYINKGFLVNVDPPVSSSNQPLDPNFYVGLTYNSYYSIYNHKIYLSFENKTGPKKIETSARGF